MKTVQLPLDVAITMYNNPNDSLKQFALANYTKEELEAKQLPTKYNEISIITGYRITQKLGTDFIQTNHSHYDNRNVFVTKEQAEASIALAQLSQLKKVYNNNWEPDYNDNTYKCVLQFSKDEIILESYIGYQHFLTFKTSEIRDKFLTNFRDLIKIAKPLL